MVSPRLCLATILTFLCFCERFSKLSASKAPAFYLDNGVDMTIAHRVPSRTERREIQEQILDLLGLHSRPRPRISDVESSAPRFLMDVYKSVTEAESGDFNIDAPTLGLSEFNISGADVTQIGQSDVIMSFVNHGSHQGSGVRHEREKQFWFDVSEVPPGDELVGAELRLFRGMMPEGSASSYTVKVYQLIPGAHEEKALEHLDSATVSGGSEGWLPLNVTAAILSWVAFPDSNLGLLVSVVDAETGHELSLSEVGIVGSKGKEGLQPFMVGFFRSHGESVLRRNTRGARRRSKKKEGAIPAAGKTQGEANTPYPFLNLDSHQHSSHSCQKKVLFVSFRDLGWQEWIIAPEGYAAFYCDGECSFPLNAHMNATNHAIVQTLVHLMNPYQVPKPWCAPTRLSGISVLYFDDNSNVILKKYRNMVVKSCGCH